MTDNLVAFIRDRLDEDEAAARTAERFHPTPWRLDPDVETTMDVGRWVADSQSEGVAVANGDGPARLLVLNPPDRVLRGVEAKRAVLAEHHILRFDDDDLTYAVTRHKHAFGCTCCHYHGYGSVMGYGYCRTLRAMATEWSTHPSYREEWAP